MPGSCFQFLSRRLLISFLIGFIIVLGLHPPIALSNPTQQVQQGIDRYQTGDYPAAIEQWKQALTTYQQTNDPQNTVIVLENLARAYQHLGQTTEEIITWDNLIKLKRQQGENATIARLLVEQAQAFSRNGQAKKAITILCNPNATGECAKDSALSSAQTPQDDKTKIAALGSLGDAYRLAGEYESAIKYLEQALAQADQHNPYQITILNALGNVYQHKSRRDEFRIKAAQEREATAEIEKFQNAQQANIQKALEYFHKSQSLAQQIGDPSAQLRSLLAAIPLESANHTPQLQQALQLFNQLPNSRDRVYAAIKLAQLYRSQHQENSQPFHCPETAIPKSSTTQSENLLNQAISIADSLQDQRAKSFALGELGHLYECHQNYTLALSTTQKAQLAAEQEADSRYLWEWQVARILKAQKKDLEAIKAYEQAIATLDPTRQGLLGSNRDLQFDFRDAIAPIYREAIALKLKTETQSNLESIIKNLGALRLAELKDYFGNDCVTDMISLTSKQSKEAMATTSTAIINTIILDDRTVVVASFPDETQKSHTITINQAKLRSEINEYRRVIEDQNATYDDIDLPKKLSEKFYKELISPFSNDLQQKGIKTLIFVQDGILRTVPMSTLYDGKQYLIEKYAIVTSPSGVLNDLKTSDRTQLRSLAMGITQPAIIDGVSFEALSNVQTELESVQNSLPQSTKLLDQDFTQSNLEQALRQKPFPILHMATHGKFGSDPADTFLLLGNQQKLTINQLEDLIRRYAHGREPIDLLALTACETAVGDDRAALGMAGIAFQAGVKSAIASLWTIDDASTADFVKDFYHYWRNDGLSKAEAMQKAQQNMIKANPNTAYWAPFILVGNWL